MRALHFYPDNQAYVYDVGSTNVAKQDLTPFLRPAVRVEVGTEQFEVLATVATEPERTKLYEQMVAVSPGFAAYQQKAAPRIIPVLILTRQS